MRRHGANVEKNGNLLKRRVALAVDTTVVLATPVDTGRARSNWVARLGQPATDVREAYAPGTSGSSGAANAQAAIDQAKGEIDKSAPEEAIHITNNLPYIGRLNDGWSAQAPAGYVPKAVLTGIQAAQSAPPIVTGNYGNG
jgi:hypothetical protein